MYPVCSCVFSVEPFSILVIMYHVHKYTGTDSLQNVMEMKACPAVPDLESCFEPRKPQSEKCIYLARVTLPYKNSLVIQLYDQELVIVWSLKGLYICNLAKNFVT